MNTNKLFLAGALAIASLSLASCSQDEPATSVAQVVNKTADRSDLDPASYGKVFVERDTTQAIGDYTGTLIWNSVVVKEFKDCSVVAVPSEYLPKATHAKEILKKGGLLVATDVKHKDIYNWMVSQDWTDMPGFQMCPDWYKDSDAKCAFVLFKPSGFEGSFAYNIDSLKYFIDSYFGLR